MKAAVVKGRRRIEIEEIPTPKVRPGTLLIRPKVCAICGTDLEYVDSPGWEGQGSGPLSMVKVGSILGHEWVGEVVEVGEGVTGWSVGDRATDIRLSCGQCYWCKRGLNHLCLGGPTRGIPHFDDGGLGTTHGAMAEYVIRSATACLKVPDSVSDEEAALTEPLNVALGAVYETGMKAADSVAILGAGHIGQLSLLASKAAGAAPVIITDKIKSRLDKALELGADVALNVDEEENVIDRVMDITEAGADIVIVCVREADVLKQATLITRREGTIAIVGFPEAASLDPLYWISKHLKIIGVDPLLCYGIQAMRLMQYKRVNCKPLISKIMPLEDVMLAFESLYNGENIVVLLKP